MNSAGVSQGNVWMLLTLMSGCCCSKVAMSAFHCWYGTGLLVGGAQSMLIVVTPEAEEPPVLLPPPEEELLLQAAAVRLSAMVTNRAEALRTRRLMSGWLVIKGPFWTGWGSTTLWRASLNH